MPDYPIDFQNGYKIQTVYANKLPDGSYGDVYDFQSDVKRAHPGAEILTGYCVIDVGLGLTPHRCKPWNDTIAEALTDYQDHIIPILEGEEPIELYVTELDVENNPVSETQFTVKSVWLQNYLGVDNKTQLEALLTNSNSWDPVEIFQSAKAEPQFSDFQEGDTVFLSGQSIQNTCISLLYRDADNYKVYSDCVIEGMLSKAQKSVILHCLDEGEYFIPEKVGLQAKTFTDLGYAYDVQSDHPWFELSKDSFEVTDRSPTTKITADQLTDAFIRCKDRWLSITPEEALSIGPDGHKPALDTVIREAEHKSGKTSLCPGKSISLSSFLAGFDFKYKIYHNDDPLELALRQQLMEDGKLEERHLTVPLLGLIDNQGADFGNIEGERFPLDDHLANSIIDRMSIYVDDGVISEFADAVKDYGFYPPKLSLKEMLLICKAHHVEEVSYTMAQAILSPETIDTSEILNVFINREAPDRERS